MVAVDTNVVVRFLTADSPAEYRRARALFSRADVFIPDTVVLETEWVLRAAYGLPAASVCEAFRSLFGLPNVAVEDARRLADTIDWHEAGLDFADAFHLARCDGAQALKTFDREFVRRARTIGPCPVGRP